MPYKFGARNLSSYWGKWFTPFSDSSMKTTNLNIFYHLGSELSILSEHCGTGQSVVDLLIYGSGSLEWLRAFLIETEEYDEYLRDSRRYISETLAALQAVTSRERVVSGVPVSESECGSLIWARQKFEGLFEHECKRLQVFTVTPKGTRDTNLLIEAPETDLPKRVIPLVPEQFIYDLRQAARCLAFDIPTACAFHSCRATESLILAYYTVLSRKSWAFKKRDWKIYIEQLGVEGAPKRITTRLDEIRASDRNAYTHPDENVPIDEAKVLYTLCSGVNYYMAEEIVRLTPP
jgi:hypothetical protein